MKRVLFFLGQLNDRDVEWMIHNGSKLELPIGYTLINKGESIDSLFIVLSGQLSIYADNSNGDSIATLEAGEIVGEMSFLESRPPSVSVVVTRPSVIYQISRDTISSRMAENPEFRSNFYYALALFLSNRLRKTTDQLGYGNPEEEDLIDMNVLDGVANAGARFGQILHRFSEV
ncbi:CRP-like cAMP-binding protein [Chryseobacterium bernardetii]|jgi:CRP-like cAMP-binding protein|uniref:CRP-like cAMP-binding protein n=4 Tax=Chryseobacterium TaxID=59732 RepID=A0A543EB29_9FLAO|nr:MULTISPECIES: cyclic nucleotide-binding domain-containing protein [Chryseobacterium]MDR4955173.1 cyclic nucleotide-binding domain-containing protein [Chryseobacterium sp. ES2]MDR6371581.1 CRP-like cAMP-binding protein [Chryseobacterium vietnamense]MDR6441915.1 CRP-like cAMP-binding protein [Chryseobacterium bernardetii]MDR6461306.1 CRP-like cAMP-binding protein [Chryseobacterium vietnamense]MDR6488242.1 CRP-like cAMP-binding protein [Chryseobacterium vietnamense]